MVEPQPFRFLDLSAELRNIIYGLVLLRDDGSTVRVLAPRGSDRARIYVFGNRIKAPPHNNVAILRASRQLNVEATPFLYRNKISFGNSQAICSFLKQIGSSVKLLRHVCFEVCCKSSIRSVMVNLKNATHLDHLEFGWIVRTQVGDASRMAKELGPWFRAFHKMRKANTSDGHQPAVDVLEFQVLNYGASESEASQARNAVDFARYSADVKDLLLKSLKD